MALPERRSISSRALKRKRGKTYREVRASVFVFDAGSRGDAASWESSGSVLVCNGRITVSQNTWIDHRNRDNVFNSSQRSSIRPFIHPITQTHSSLWFFSDQTVMAPHKQMVAVQKHEGHLQMDLPPPHLLFSTGLFWTARSRSTPCASELFSSVLRPSECCSEAPDKLDPQWAWLVRWHSWVCHKPTSPIGCCLSA